MEEQIESIAQAKAEEQQTIQKQTISLDTQVPEAVIGRALTSRGNDWHSVERIVAFFQKQPLSSSAAFFMEKEFGVGGKGVKIAGQDYALWFDKEGFRIAPGRSAFGPGSTLVTWANAAAMTEKLLREGMFAPQEKIDNAQDNEYLELAAKLWYLRQDFSEGAREKNLLPTISRYFFNKGFPDDTQQIAEQLRNPDSRKQILQELAVFMVAQNDDPDLLRFNRIHTPEKLYADVAALYTTPVQFRAAEGFVPAKASFITEDEIDHLLMRGGNVSESKLRIYSYFIQGHDAKECADFLKQEYGSGGHSSIGFAERHDSKGIRFTRQDKESGYKGYDTVKLNWNQVQKRIRGLIDSGRYLNEQEKAYLPSYDKLALAREIYAFNYYKPNDPDGTYSHEWDPETAKRDILPLLDSPEQVEKLFDRMLDDFAPLSPDTPHYITLRTALRDVGMYQRGESPNFSPLPEKVLQAERRGRWAAKEAKRAEQVQHTPPPLKEPEGRLAAAARALSKKIQPQAVEEDDGQISFALFSPQPQESPIVEALPPTKEQAGTPVSTAVLPPDYKAIKEANPDSIVLYQVGNAFEIFGEDAKLAASILKLEPTRLVPDMNQITACGIPANELDEYVERLRDQYDVTLVSFDEQTGERRSRTVLSVGHEAEQAIDRAEAEFGADGWRVFRDTGEKDMSGKAADPGAALTVESSLGINSTIHEIYEHYAPMVKNLVLVDEAYRNACVNSDRDLAHLEGNDAVKRAVLTINDPVLMKQYYDNAAFRNRLHQEIISETYPTLSQLQQEQAEPLSPRSVGAPVKSQQSNRSGRSKPELNYRTLAQMFPEIASGEYRYLSMEAGGGMMPLHLEWIDTDVIAISHTYVQNGDLMRDPEMTFRMDREKGTLEPLTFQQDGGIPIYQEVYPEPGKWVHKLRNDLNTFAQQWFKNISEQGYLKKEAVVERDGEDVRLAFDPDGNALSPALDVPEEPAAQQNPDMEISVSTDSPQRFDIVRLWGGNAPFGIWDNESEAFCEREGFTLQFVEQSNAENYVKNIQQIGGQLIFPEPSAGWVANPVALYAQALNMLDRAVESSYLHGHLRDRSLDYTGAWDVLNTELPQLMERAITSYPEIKAAYQLLPMFREWLIEDILERNYQDVPDGLDATARHVNDPDAPEWLKKALANPAVEHLAAEQDGGNTTVPQASGMVPDLTGAGAPEQEESDLSAAAAQNLTPNVEEYLNLKVQHPDKLIGVQVGDYMLFYGKDAEEAARALDTELVTQEIPGLGTTAVTGSKAVWQATLKGLLEHGQSVVLARPDPEHGPDAPYEIIKERDAAEYIPIGMELTIDGRRMKIDSVAYDSGTVSLVDLEMKGWFPIFRVEPIPFVREFVEEVQQSEEYIAAEMAALLRTEADELEAAKELIRDFCLREYGSEEVNFSDLEHIGIAYTTTEDEEHEIQVEVDLLNFSIVQFLDGRMVEQTTYNSLGELNRLGLDGLNFDELVQLNYDPSPLPERVELDGGKIAPPAPVQLSQERRNFHITDDNLGVGGEKAKYQYNVAAIRTLKRIEAEGRLATPEEQKTLSRYVGWGGIAKAFDPDDPKWTKEYAELKELLTPEEYNSARSTVLNAHYTSPTVIKAVYQAVERMNFKPGTVLEPSMGIGNFFGLLPDSLADAKLYGVELDSLTGRIARQLYQNADITVAGFETTDRRDFYDLAVGNVPFGQYKVNDPAYNKLGFNIHNYFFAKALDQVRPGGIVAFVTSRYTMDAKDSTVRRYLAERADLLGAVRLPNNAFKANAGTEVVSDIIFLQKRDRPAVELPGWVEVGENDDGFSINSYFLDHPDMVLGIPTSDSTQYGRQDYTVAPIEEADLSAQLAEAIQHLAPPDRETLEIVPEQEDGKEIESIPADHTVRNFSYTLHEGKLYFRENSRMTRVELGKVPTERVKGMIAIRDCVRKLIDLQLGNAGDDEVKAEQARLDRLYGQFTKKHGLLNSQGNKLAFEQDSSYPLLCSLEVLDNEGNLKRKADMFTKRTIQNHRAVTSVDTAVEALAVSISEKACVDLGFMASLMGGSDKIPQIVDDLKGIIFKDPSTGPFDIETGGTNWYKGWQTADEYLSGDVRWKLRQARFAAEDAPEFAVNVEKLEQVQPKDLTASEISVRIGASWIDPAYYQQFMYELLHTPLNMQSGKIRLMYSDSSGEWRVTNKSADSKDNVRVHATYGTKRINAYEIFEATLNQRDVRIFDKKWEDGKEVRVLNEKQTAIAQQKQEAIGEAFKDWIFKDPERREALCKKYNETFNNIRPREYDGAHINFVGMNPEIDLGNR